MAEHRQKRNFRHASPSPKSPTTVEKDRSEHVTDESDHEQAWEDTHSEDETTPKNAVVKLEGASFAKRPDWPVKAVESTLSQRLRSEASQPAVAESVERKSLLERENPADVRKAMLVERQNNKQARRIWGKGVAFGKEAQAEERVSRYRAWDDPSPW